MDRSPIPASLSRTLTRWTWAVSSFCPHHGGAVDSHNGVDAKLHGVWRAIATASVKPAPNALRISRVPAKWLAVKDS